MRAFINELALAEACAEAPVPYLPLEELLEARRQHPVFVKNLYCARGMPNVQVRPKVTLLDIAKRLPRDKFGMLLQWTAKKGPFMEDDRQEIDEDLFHFEEEDVTDLGLGEAARRILASRPAWV